MRILISWIGRTDLKSATKDQPATDPGPVLRLLRREKFDVVHLLNDIPPNQQHANESSPASQLCTTRLNHVAIDRVMKSKWCNCRSR